MKKVLIISAIFVGITTVSCSSNDDDKNMNPAIVGNWKPIAEVHKNIITGMIFDELDVCEPFSVYTFTNLGTINANIYYGDDANDCNNYNLMANYVVNGNNLTFIYDGVPDAIVHHLSFSNSNNTMDWFSIDGSYEVTITFSRIN